jgi:hypothetical protein
MVRPSDKSLACGIAQPAGRTSSEVFYAANPGPLAGPARAGRRCSARRGRRHVSEAIDFYTASSAATMIALDDRFRGINCALAMTAMRTPLSRDSGRRAATAER